MDRASTIRFYDHYGHVSAAVCYQNTLHARTGDGRLDHARTHEPREGKGVNELQSSVTINHTSVFTNLASSDESEMRLC